MQAETAITKKTIDLNLWMTWLAGNWLLILACIPVIRIFLLTSWDGEFASWQDFSRIFWLPSLVLEMLVFVVAVLHGLNISQMIRKLPRIAKVLLSLWFLSLLGSTYLADTVPMIAYRGAAFWFVHLLFFAAAAHLIRVTDATSTPKIELFALVLAGASAFAGLFIFALVLIIGIDSGFEWGMHLPGYANLRHTGYFFAPAIALGLAHIAGRPSRYARTHMLFLIGNTASMLWLGSRGPVLGIAAGLVMGTILFAEMRTRSFWKMTASGLGIGALLSVVMPIPANSSFGAIQRFWTVPVNSGGFSSGRVEFWLESIDLILKKPFLGYGAHQYQYASEMAVGTFKHPHNSVIQFIFDWGFIGGGLFLCLLGYAAFTAFLRRSSASYSRLIAAMGLVTMFAYSAVDGILFYPYTIAIFIVLILIPTMDSRGSQADQV